MSRSRACVPFLVMVLSAVGQTSWQLVTTGQLGCLNHAYDSGSDLVVALHGPTTMLFDGRTWSAISGITPGGGPLAYDRGRRKVVCYEDTHALTWEWDGSVWQVVALVGPLAWAAGTTWSASRQRVMLFGGALYSGQSTPQGMNELWEWDGTAWSLVPANNPPPTTSIIQNGTLNTAVYNTLVYDARRDRLVVSGRMLYPRRATIPVFGPGTWEWSASTGWQEVLTSSFEAYNLVYDERRARCVAVGPWGAGARAYEWDGTGAWTIGAATPFNTGCLILAYDSRRGRTLFARPNGEYWAYGPTNPATVDLHRPGCTAGGAVPTLTPSEPWTRPWLGGTYVIDVAPLPANLALLIAGFGDQQHGTIRLPLDLTPLGMPGCQLHITPETTVLLAGANGRATASLQVPNTASLLGQHLFQQAIVLAPAANAAGLVVSDSVRAVVGRLN